MSATRSAWGTGLAETEVLRLAAGRYAWSRRPGADVRVDGSARARPVPAGFARRAALASSAAFEFALPEFDADQCTHTWTAPGPFSVAHALMGAAGDLTPQRVADEVAEPIGRAMRAFHAIGNTDIEDEYPQLEYAARLSRWMRTGEGTRDAAVWHKVLSGGLGTARWDLLAAYAEDALSTEGSATVALGWATLGSVVAPAPAVDDGWPTRPPALLCGDHACLAAPETDLGCMLGELCELEASLARNGASAAAIESFRQALLRGYGPGLDPDLVTRAAIIRIAVHSHDYAAFVGFHIDLHTYVALLADLLDRSTSAPMQGEG
jgi:hypothetical protein